LYPRGYATVGADFHRAMVATASGEKLLIGACEELDPPYDIELVFVQKITLVLRKIRKNCCHQSCTFYAPNRLQRSPRSPSCISWA